MLGKQSKEKGRFGPWSISVGLWSKWSLISSFLPPPSLQKSQIQSYTEELHHWFKPSDDETEKMELEDL